MERRGAGALTARDRFWLGHLRAIERSKETATRYTRRRGLSTGALWQAARRLEGLGAWTRRPRERGSARAESSVSFARVAVQSGVVASLPGARLRLPGGVELEWAVAPDAEWLGALLERLAARG